jgi:hypothetical protein
MRASVGLRGRAMIPKPLVWLAVFAALALLEALSRI